MARPFRMAARKRGVTQITGAFSRAIRAAGFPPGPLRMISFPGTIAEGGTGGGMKAERRCDPIYKRSGVCEGHARDIARPLGASAGFPENPSLRGDTSAFANSETAGGQQLPQAGTKCSRQIRLHCESNELMNRGSICAREAADKLRGQRAAACSRTREHARRKFRTRGAVREPRDFPECLEPGAFRAMLLGSYRRQIRW